jgi:hypothetical protein
VRGGWTPVMAAVLCVGAACGDGAPPDGRSGPGSAGAGAESAAAADSLLLLARSDSISPTRLPPDWYDLLHPRFSNRVAFPDPEEFPLARGFMETVMQAEAARTGQPDSGLDWLLRWDGTVAVYYRDLPEGILPFRRGEVVLLVIPASRAGTLVGREDVVVVPMQSGGLPRITFPGSSEVAEGGASDDVEVSAEWLSDWRTRIRGRNPAR